MEHKVLVITCSEDTHADSVCQYLTGEKVQWFRVNSDKLIGNYHLTFDSGTDSFRISNKNEEITLDESWNVWNRRILDPLLPKDIPQQLEHIVFDETRRTWESLLQSCKGRVVNRPIHDYAAKDKIDQLRFAKNYGNGIAIPHTILTNDPQKFEQFYTTHPRICHKLMKGAVVKQRDGQLTVYNNIVPETSLKNAPLIERNPCLFQEYIEKEYEIRITALQTEIIGIAIHSQDSDISKVDYRRYDFEKVKYERVNLPPHVTQFCHDLLKNYGLAFGQIDMIYSPRGEYTFLEINPRGQWLWLELKSKFPLTKYVVENLLI